MNQSLKYMQLALELAKKGLGDVEPNPAVGAVIVKGGKIIGRGWHKKFGGPHAEINALNDCKKRGINPKGSTMYVTLEPCCHYGKTGPCANAIIKAKLEKVVIAVKDPSQHANGKGIRLLKKAGIKVEQGLCETQAKILNSSFLKYASRGIPWVILKWAQSLDGKLAWARTGSRRKWISSRKSRQDVHKFRRQAGAILVGINTVLKDDPLLTPRPAKGRKPLRIVLDNHLRIPINCKLMKTAKKLPLLIITKNNVLRNKAGKAEQILKAGGQIAAYPAKQSNLKFLVSLLSKRGVQRLIVEGGPSVIESFIKENLADEIIIYMAPRILNSKGTADISHVIKHLQFHTTDIKCFGSDIRICGLTNQGRKSLHIGDVYESGK